MSSSTSRWSEMKSPRRMLVSVTCRDPTGRQMTGPSLPRTGSEFQLIGGLTGHGRIAASLPSIPADGRTTCSIPASSSSPLPTP